MMEEVISTYASRFSTAKETEIFARKTVSSEPEALLAREGVCEEIAPKQQESEYDVGWSATQIPRSEQGMVCLKMDETGALTIAPTTESVAAVNLEYLSIALKVRSQEGREPFFSLDPVEARPGEDSVWMQKKRFEPEWLAGTSVGEVMFQADYQLKELSMGACDQPVTGMKSVLDMMGQEAFDAQWSAREWFIVRKAEVQMSEDNVLVPFVKMGVEAREQNRCAGEAEDSKITRADHPLVKYAEEFTRNFDLIAERKSVIYHLRELAKASILAKYLLETEVPLEESWFNFAGETTECSLEVPAAFNNFNGKSVFGGVQFGIDRFSLSAPSAAMVTRAGRISAPLGAMSAARVSAPLAAMAHARISAPLGAMSAARVSAPLRAMSAARVSAPIGAMRAARGRPLASMARVSAPIAALSAATARAPLAWGASRLAAARPLTSTMSLAAGLERPQGVDLDLNKFDLSTTHKMPEQTYAGSWSTAIAEKFWENVDGSSSVFSDDDVSLLRLIFNPHLSDRRMEGDLFLPPDASFSLVKKLRNLTKSEEMVRAQRKELFLSQEFSAESASALFPAGWATCSSNIVGKASTDKLESALKTAKIEFSKVTEDGMRFSVYRSGDVEFRATQEHGCKELIGAAYELEGDLKSHIMRQVQMLA